MIRIFPSYILLMFWCRVCSFSFIFLRIKKSSHFPSLFVLFKTLSLYSKRLLSTNDKITADGIFDLKDWKSHQKKFSQICLDSTRGEGYNVQKKLIWRYKLFVYFLSLSYVCKRWVLNGRLLYIYFRLFCLLFLFLLFVDFLKMFTLNEKQRLYIVNEWENGSKSVAQMTRFLDPLSPVWSFLTHSLKMSF